MFTPVYNSIDRSTNRDAFQKTRILPTAATFGLFALTVISAFLASGCSSTPKVQLPKVIGENPSFSEFIGAVNKNSAKINSIHFPNARVGVATQYGTAACTISYQRTDEKSDKFRMVGVSSSMGGRFIDLGSTGATFWCWEKNNEANEIYTCDLDKFSGSELANLLPLDPTWFPEALGIVTISEEDLLEAPTDNKDGTFRTKIKRTRPDGVYTEYVYFKPETAAIVRQDVQDPRGRTIVSVRCQSHQYVKDVDLVLPDSLVVDCIDAGMKLDFSLREPIVNDASKLLSFEIPADNARKVDLSKKTDVAANAPVQNAAASSAPNPSTASETQAANGLQGSDAVDASKYRRSLPESPTYTAPVESGAGIVPFPTADAVAASPPPTAQNNVGGQSYLVVPEIARPSQDVVQPIKTASATVEQPIGLNESEQIQGATFEAPDLTQSVETNPTTLVPQTTYLEQNQSQTLSSPAIAPSARYQQARVQGAANRGPVYPGVSVENLESETVAPQVYSPQNWETTTVPRAPTTLYEPSQYPDKEDAIQKASSLVPPTAFPNERNLTPTLSQPPTSMPGNFPDDQPNFNDPSQAPSLDFPEIDL